VWDCKVERREVTHSGKNCLQRIRYEIILSFLYVSKSKGCMTNRQGRWKVFRWRSEILLPVNYWGINLLEFLHYLHCPKNSLKNSVMYTALHGEYDFTQAWGNGVLGRFHMWKSWRLSLNTLLHVFIFVMLVSCN